MFKYAVCFPVLVLDVSDLAELTDDSFYRVFRPLFSDVALAVRKYPGASITWARRNDDAHTHPSHVAIVESPHLARSGSDENLRRKLTAQLKVERVFEQFFSGDYKDAIDKQLKDLQSKIDTAVYLKLIDTTEAQALMEGKNDTLTFAEEPCETPDPGRDGGTDGP